MVSLTFYFKIDAKAELSYEEGTEEYASVYTSISFNDCTTLGDIENLKEGAIKLLCNNFDISKDLITLISRKTYEENTEDYEEVNFQDEGNFN